MPSDLLPTGSRKMTVAYNTVSQLIGRGLSGGATFLISIILAHAYGARGFGDFTIITTFVAVFYLFADFGLNAVFLQDDLKQSAAWQTLIAARILISIVSIVLALSILSFLPVGIDRGYTSVIKLGIILYCPTIFSRRSSIVPMPFFSRNSVTICQPWQWWPGHWFHWGWCG